MYLEKIAASLDDTGCVYLQGMLDACAERGVDPEPIVKRAIATSGGWMTPTQNSNLSMAQTAQQEAEAEQENAQKLQEDAKKEMEKRIKANNKATPGNTPVGGPAPVMATPPPIQPF